MKKLLLIFISITLSLNIYMAQEKNYSETIKIDNFHIVDKDLFRSSQPNKSGFIDLEKAGIKEVLNLRNHHSDDDEAKGTNIKLHRIKMNAGSLTEEELLKALNIIKNRKGPILVHCWHGSDRTGAVIAMYRIVFQDWTKEEAIHELINGGYGHHKWYYQNIPELIKEINIAEFKRKLSEMN